MTENNGDIRANEGDILQGLLAAGSDVQEATQQITIQRHGKTFFSFRIRPLTEQEYAKANDQATKKELNKQLGITIPIERDDSQFRSLLIYAATVDEDKQALWNNQTALQHFNVLGGLDLIEKVLLAGEKQAIVRKIDELSGFGADVDVKLEATAKNS